MQVTIGTCRRPGCTEDRAEGQGRQLCRAHGLTAARIIAGRVPRHIFRTRVSVPTVECCACGKTHELAGMTVKAARYQAQVWACEHACGGGR